MTSPARGMPLTAQELELVAHLANGNANIQIDYLMGLREGSAAEMLRQVGRKLGTTGRAEIGLRAFRTGLLRYDAEAKRVVPASVSPTEQAPGAGCSCGGATSPAPRRPAGVVVSASVMAELWALAENVLYGQPPRVTVPQARRALEMAGRRPPRVASRVRVSSW